MSIIEQNNYNAELGDNVKLVNLNFKNDSDDLQGIDQKEVKIFELYPTIWVMPEKVTKEGVIATSDDDKTIYLKKITKLFNRLYRTPRGKELLEYIKKGCSTSEMLCEDKMIAIRKRHILEKNIDTFFITRNSVNSIIVNSTYNEGLNLSEYIDIRKGHTKLDTGGTAVTAIDLDFMGFIQHLGKLQVDPLDPTLILAHELINIFNSIYDINPIRGRNIKEGFTTLESIAVDRKEFMKNMSAKEKFKTKANNVAHLLNNNIPFIEGTVDDVLFFSPLSDNKRSQLIKILRTNDYILDSLSENFLHDDLSREAGHYNEPNCNRLLRLVKENNENIINRAHEELKSKFGIKFTDKLALFASLQGNPMINGILAENQDLFTNLKSEVKKLHPNVELKLPLDTDQLSLLEKLVISNNGIKNLFKGSYTYYTVVTNTVKEIKVDIDTKFCKLDFPKLVYPINKSDYNFLAEKYSIKFENERFVVDDTKINKFFNDLSYEQIEIKYKKDLSSKKVLVKNIFSKGSDEIVSVKIDILDDSQFSIKDGLNVDSNKAHEAKKAYDAEYGISNNVDLAPPGKNLRNTILDTNTARVMDFNPQELNLDNNLKSLQPSIEEKKMIRYNQEILDAINEYKIRLSLSKEEIAAEYFIDKLDLSRKFGLKLNPKYDNINFIKNFKKAYSTANNVFIKANSQIDDLFKISATKAKLVSKANSAPSKPLALGSLYDLGEQIFADIQNEEDYKVFLEHIGRATPYASDFFTIKDEIESKDYLYLSLTAVSLILSMRFPVASIPISLYINGVKLAIAQYRFSGNLVDSIKLIEEERKKNIEQFIDFKVKDLVDNYKELFRTLLTQLYVQENNLFLAINFNLENYSYLLRDEYEKSIATLSEIDKKNKLKSFDKEIDLLLNQIRNKLNVYMEKNIEKIDEILKEYINTAVNLYIEECVMKDLKDMNKMMKNIFIDYINSLNKRPANFFDKGYDLIQEWFSNSSDLTTINHLSYANIIPEGDMPYFFDRIDYVFNGELYTACDKITKSFKSIMKKVALRDKKRYFDNEKKEASQICLLENVGGKFIDKLKNYNVISKDLMASSIGRHNNKNTVSLGMISLKATKQKKHYHDFTVSFWFCTYAKTKEDMDSIKENRILLLSIGDSSEKCFFKVYLDKLQLKINTYEKANKDELLNNETTVLGTIIHKKWNLINVSYNAKLKCFSVSLNGSVIDTGIYNKLRFHLSSETIRLGGNYFSKQNLLLIDEFKILNEKTPITSVFNNYVNSFNKNFIYDTYGGAVSKDRSYTLLTYKNNNNKGFIYNNKLNILHFANNNTTYERSPYILDISSDIKNNKQDKRLQQITNSDNIINRSAVFMKIKDNSKFLSLLSPKYISAKVLGLSDDEPKDQFIKLISARTAHNEFKNEFSSNFIYIEEKNSKNKLSDNQHLLETSSNLVFLARTHNHLKKEGFKAPPRLEGDDDLLKTNTTNSLLAYHKIHKSLVSDLKDLKGHKFIEHYNKDFYKSTAYQALGYVFYFKPIEKDSYDDDAIDS